MTRLWKHAAILANHNEVVCHWYTSSVGSCLYTV